MKATPTPQSSIAASSDSCLPCTSKANPLPALPKQAQALAPHLLAESSQPYTEPLAETVLPSQPPPIACGALSTPVAADTAAPQWPVVHAMFIMILACKKPDAVFGEVQLDRKSLEHAVKAQQPAKTLLALCPWIVNALSLNDRHWVGLNQHGIERDLHTRFVNFVSLFLHRDEPPTRCSRGTEPSQFYDTFAADVFSGIPISEERAREFWVPVFHLIALRERLRAFRRETDNITIAAVITKAP